MQDMLVTVGATSTNALMDTNKNRRQFVNITLANTTRTYQVFVFEFRDNRNQIFALFTHFALRMVS